MTRIRQRKCASNKLFDAQSFYAYDIITKKLRKNNTKLYSY